VVLTKIFKVTCFPIGDAKRVGYKSLFHSAGLLSFFMKHHNFLRLFVCLKN